MDYRSNGHTRPAKTGRYEGDPVSERSGRKRRLTEEEGQQIREMYLHGQALLAEAQRYLPKALAKRYHIATATVYGYVEQRHKGEPGYEMPRQGNRAGGRLSSAIAEMRASHNEIGGSSFVSAS